MQQFSRLEKVDFSPIKAIAHDGSNLQVLLETDSGFSLESLPDLEPTFGEAIADFVVESGQSVVLDLSTFSGNETTTFITEFAQRLYQRKAKDRSLLHLILDEADSFAPQKPLPGEQRMLGAVDKIVRRGRARGLGVTLVTQRPAAINKNVLTQIEVLIALRTVSPQDRKANELPRRKRTGYQNQNRASCSSLCNLR